MPKLTPNLWFDNQAEEAAKFYVSVFKELRRHGRHALSRGAPR